MEKHSLIHDTQRYVGHGSFSEVGINSLRPNGTYMRHQTRGSLVQIITCHYLNQWCIIVNQTLIIKLQSNCIQNSHIFIQENAFENVVWKMSAIMSRPQCANLTQLRHDPKQMDCLQSKVFWVVHCPETPALGCLGGWMVYRPPCPIITHQNIHLIFDYLHVADILIQYICWNQWKNWKIKGSRCRFLTRPIWQFWHGFLAMFSIDWPLSAPMLFQYVNNCPTNISDLLW